MIQGGDRLGQGTGGPGYKFADEFHPVAAAHQGRHPVDGQRRSRTPTAASSSSRSGPTPHLDNRHSVFGEVVEGLDVVKRIGAVPTGAQDRPVTPVVMNKVTIERVA